MRFSPLLLGLPLALAAASFARPVELKLSDNKGAPIADAVVSLTPVGTAVKTTPPAEPLEIVQRGLEFNPYVTPVVVGTTIVFPNRDTVQHHVYSLSKPKKFELPLYGGETKASVIFDQPGVVAIGCNIHDWMSAYIVVLETPWFAKTGANGVASISNVPAGRYRAEVWHPRLKEPETLEITVPEGMLPPLSLTLKRDLRIRRAPDGNSSGYK
jgi:plastocyanin